MSTDEYEDSDGDSIKKKGKKKQYPFGTPSHLHHPYSQFAHISNPSTKFFAEDLAKATGVELQTLEEQTKPARKRIVAKPAAKPKDTGGGEDDDTVSILDEIPDNEGEEPCTKIPCQVVLRQLVDLQLKNQMEKLEIEDKYEMLLDELKVVQEEIGTAEGKLDKANEIGNLLEVKAGNLQVKVESLEKSRDGLTAERSEINQKVMIMEIERQKLTRKLEQAQKALSDAMWRKKKQAKEQQVADGYSLATSVISEYPIVQSSQKVVSSANSMASTPYDRLARGVVRDYIERPPTVKTVPSQVIEKMIKNSHQGKPGFMYSMEEATIDKYSKKYYNRMIEAGKQSWEQQETSVIGANVSFYSSHNLLLDDTHHHTGGHHDTNHHSYSASNSASDLLDEEDMRTVVFGVPKQTGLLNNHSPSTAVQRMGNYLQTRSNLSTAASLDKTAAGAVRNREYDCTNQTIRLTKSMAALTPIHKPLHKAGRRSTAEGGSSSSTAGGRKSMRLSPLRGTSSGRMSPSEGSGANLTGNSFAEGSAVSGLTGTHSGRERTRGGGKTSQQQLGSSLDRDDLSRNTGSPVSRTRVQTAASSNYSINSFFTQSSKLDPVFFKAQACAQFARKHPVGHIRVIRPTTAELAAMSVPNLPIEGGHRRSSQASVGSHASGDTNGKKSVHGKTLTVKHPGMDVFNQSLKL